MDKVIIRKANYRMCVLAKVATAFELASTYFQVKKESYAELKKKEKKNEYKNIEQKKRKIGVMSMTVLCVV